MKKFTITILIFMLFAMTNISFAAKGGKGKGGGKAKSNEAKVTAKEKKGKASEEVNENVEATEEASKKSDRAKGKGGKEKAKVVDEAGAEEKIKAAKESRKKKHDDLMKKQQEKMKGRGKGKGQQQEAFAQKKIREEAKHEQRLARLNRMRALVAEAGDKKKQDRIEKLIGKEGLRYMKKMRKLEAQQGRSTSENVIQGPRTSADKGPSQGPDKTYKGCAAKR